MRTRTLLAAAVAATVGSAAWADLTVNNNLGNLAPGNYAIAGTTVGNDNGADTYAPIANTTAIWDQDYVYQFNIASAVTASIDTNDPNGAVDNDFFLLTSLGTTVNASGLNQASGAIGSGIVEVDGVYGVIQAGTYYLSVDAWRGVPGAAGTPAVGRAGAFSGTLALTAFVPPTPPPSTDAVLGGSISGTLAPGGHAWYRFDYAGGGFTLDTEGSVFAPSNDTELGLFNSNGQLVAQDDDGGTGLLSSLNSPAGLAAGTYYVAVGGFNTTHAGGFSATGGTNGGSFVLNGLQIVPEPTGLAALGLVASMVVRRRRSAR